MYKKNLVLREPGLGAEQYTFAVGAKTGMPTLGYAGRKKNEAKAKNALKSKARYW